MISEISLVFVGCQRGICPKDKFLLSFLGFITSRFFIRGSPPNSLKSFSPIHPFCQLPLFPDGDIPPFLSRGSRSPQFYFTAGNKHYSSTTFFLHWEDWLSSLLILRVSSRCDEARGV